MGQGRLGQTGRQIGTRALRPAAMLMVLVGALSILAGLIGPGASPAEAVPNLDIRKSTHVHSAQVKGYEITARNTGTAPATPVKIVDDMDDSIVILAIHSVAAGWSCSLAAGNVLTCDFVSGTIPSQFSTISIVDACDPLKRASVPNNASIYLNNVVQDTDTANPNLFACDPASVTLAKSNDTGGSVAAGGTFNWIITVTVSGNNATSTITDTIPAAFTVGTVTDNAASISCGKVGNVVTCNLTNTPVGTYQITIPVTAPDGDPTNECTSYTNTSSITAGDSNGQSDSDNILVVCRGEAGLDIVKAGPATINTGGTITYTITVTNTGSAAASVVVTDDLPDSLTGVSASYDVDPAPAGDTACSVGAGNVVTCNIGGLAQSDGNTTAPENDVVEVVITATVNGCADLSNNASVSFETAEVAPDAVTTSNTVVTDVICGSITIVKEVSPGEDPQDFTFADNIAGCDIGVLDDDPVSATLKSTICGNIPPASYSITEAVPSNWDLDGVECTGLVSSTTSSIANGIQITLVGAENVVCTFVNVRETTVTQREPTSTRTPPRETEPTPVIVAQVQVIVATPVPPAPAPARIAEVQEVRGLPQTGSGADLRGGVDRDRIWPGALLVLLGLGTLALSRDWAKPTAR